MAKPLDLKISKSLEPKQGQTINTTLLANRADLVHHFLCYSHFDTTPEAIELINLDDADVEYYNRQAQVVFSHGLEHTLADYLARIEDEPGFIRHRFSLIRHVIQYNLTTPSTHRHCFAMNLLPEDIDFMKKCYLEESVGPNGRMKIEGSRSNRGGVPLLFASSGIPAKPMRKDRLPEDVEAAWVRKRLHDCRKLFQENHEIELEKFRAQNREDKCEEEKNGLADAQLKQAIQDAEARQDSGEADTVVGGPAKTGLSTVDKKYAPDHPVYPGTDQPIDEEYDGHLIDAINNIRSVEAAHKASQGSMSEEKKHAKLIKQLRSDACTQHNLFNAGLFSKPRPLDPRLAEANLIAKNAYDAEKAEKARIAAEAGYDTLPDSVYKKLKEENKN